MNYTLLGKVFIALYMIRRYKNGSSEDFIWRWYNPINWIVVPIIVFLNILVYGVVKTIRNKHELGFGVDPFFKANNMPIEWIK